MSITSTGFEFMNGWEPELAGKRVITRTAIKGLIGSAAKLVGYSGSEKPGTQSKLPSSANSSAPIPTEPPALRPKPDWYPVSYIPQADTADRIPFLVEDRDWRAHFVAYLSGKGLEIGPLHRPMVRHEKMDIDYLDRHTVSELKVKYSELGDIPLVEPHIIDDAETLETVPSGKYDFVIAAHVIEHMKNPLGALEQWMRVLKPGGLLYLVVPDKRATFDCPRTRTLLYHLVLDYLRPSRERDFDHYLEYSVLVDGKRNEEAFSNAQKLADADHPIHFHVFLPEDIIRLLGWFSNNVRRVEIVDGPSAYVWSDEFNLLIRVP